MLHITISNDRRVKPDEDGLGRKRVGYYDGMSQQALYTASRGCWVMGGRAVRERHALVTYDGIVRQAIEVHGIIDVSPVRSGKGRRAIEGRILTAGDPVYDTYVGKPSPVGRVRNPITYFDDPVSAPFLESICFRLVKNLADQHRRQPPLPTLPVL